MLCACPAIFCKEEEGYSVTFPDLDYLSIEGDSLEEALEMAVDCLAGWLYRTKIENEKIPPPSDLKAVDPIEIFQQLGSEADDYFVNLITIDVEEYAKVHFNKSVKKTLTIPDWLNREALAKRINFSQVLQEALIKKLHSM